MKEDEENIEEQYASEIPQRYRDKGYFIPLHWFKDYFVFENLNLTIPYQKTTAIVGASGSGKTTLLKLLMKFYEPNTGEIKIGNTNLKNISPRFWREHLWSIVMQDGYVFNDTIAENIAVGQDYIDKQKLRKAVEIANIKDFIEELPLSYNTKIGNEGIGISGGQNKIIYCRAVYKSPEYIFFDEATSALDANNEKIIMENLEQFFKGKTAIVIAHRLSTVKHADKIIVLDKGKVVEEGNHTELVAKKGEYYRLVKNQLELGN